MLTIERGAVLAAVAAVDSEGPDAALDDSEEPLRENDGSCIGIHFVKTRARVALIELGRAFFSRLSRAAAVASA